jgi:putative membrane protein
MLNLTEGNEKAIMRGIFVLSGVVFIAVVVLGMLPQAEHIPPFVKYLPKLNALINATCSVLLIISLYHIKNKNVIMHKKLNLLTFVLSSIFLLSYVTFHSFGVETKFPADNPIRPPVSHHSDFTHHTCCAGFTNGINQLLFWSVQ